MRREFGVVLKDHGVTIGEWAVLASIFHGEASTPSEVSKVAGIDPAMATRQLDRLTDEKGYTSRQVSQNDRRSFTVKLTKAGRRITEKLLAENERINNEFLSGITRSERVELKRLLQQMLNNRP